MTLQATWKASPHFFQIRCVRPKRTYYETMRLLIILAAGVEYDVVYRSIIVTDYSNSVLRIVSADGMCVS